MFRDPVRYWCGFLEKQSKTHGRRILIKTLDEPRADNSLLNKSRLGSCAQVAETLALSVVPPQGLFLGEGVLLRSLDPCVQVKVCQNLSAVWAREILWRRAREIGGAVQEELAKKILALPLEKLVESCWTWCEPRMFQRCCGQAETKNAN